MAYGRNWLISRRIYRHKNYGENQAKFAQNRTALRLCLFNHRNYNNAVAKNGDFGILDSHPLFVIMGVAKWGANLKENENNAPKTNQLDSYLQ